MFRNTKNKKRIKVLYFIYDIDKALIFEWIFSKINQNKFELVFVLLNYRKSGFEDFLTENNGKFYRVEYKDKSDILKAFLKVFKIIIFEKPKIVHCHYFDANIIGIISSFFLGVKKRIYTRHYSTYHHDYFPKAVWYDKLINWFSTDIISISKVVSEVLIEKEKVQQRKIHLIHHGLIYKDFNEVEETRIASLKKKYEYENNFPVIGVISRQTELKGIQYIIPAFKDLLVDYPNAKLVLANAVGDYKNEINFLLSTLPKETFIEIRFEYDTPAFYKTFDVFVHCPIDIKVEAFGLTYIESLAAGIPSVFTLSGVASEFIEHKKNAIVVSHKNVREITDAIKLLITDNTLRQKIIQNGNEDVKNFDFENMLLKLEELYSSK
ncbi:MAG: glycosyltransferase family 4 protein [Cytophagales bacterium]